MCVHVHSNKWRWSSDEVSRQKQTKVLYTSYHYQIKTESLLLYVEVLSAGLLTSGKFERLLDFVHVNSCESPMSLPLVQDGFEWLNKSHYLLKTCTIDELH